MYMAATRSECVDGGRLCPATADWERSRGRGCLLSAWLFSYMPPPTLLGPDTEGLTPAQCVKERDRDRARGTF